MLINILWQTKTFDGGLLQAANDERFILRGQLGLTMGNKCIYRTMVSFLTLFFLGQNPWRFNSQYTKWEMFVGLISPRYTFST